MTKHLIAVGSGRKPGAILTICCGRDTFHLASREDVWTFDPNEADCAAARAGDGAEGA